MKAASKFLSAASAAALSAALVVPGAFVVGMVSVSTAQAAVVSRIEVRGNSRVDADTVRNHIAIKPGKSFSSADIDEADVGRVRPGQRTWCTAAAYGDRRFSGRVVSVGRMLGNKRIRTDEPTERLDTQTLEAMIALDELASMPIGLRVDVYLEVAQE